MAEKVNIGQAIREEMDRTGRTVTWLSKQLGTNRMACYRIFNSYSIDTKCCFVSRFYWAETSSCSIPQPSARKVKAH